MFQLVAVSISVADVFVVIIRRRTIARRHALFTVVYDVLLVRQVAQLSQRDRAAGWVSYGQKWKTGTGRQYLRTI